MTSILIALALAVAPLTSSRQEATYGPSDLLLLFAAIVSAAAALNRTFAWGNFIADTPAGRHGIAAVRPVLLYSSVAVFLVVISTLANLDLVVREGSPAIALAGYFVSFGLVVALFLEAAGGGLRTIVFGYCVFSFAIMLVYLAGYAIGYDAFFYGPRFIGLSENPNQTALHMVCVLVVAVAALGKLERDNWIWPLFAWANIPLAALLGILSNSDAFTIALVVMVVVGTLNLLVLKATQSVTALGLVVFVVMPVTIIVLLLAVDDLRAVPQLILERMEFRNQDSVRFLLWRNGLAAWQESWLLGNGPGGWSGYVRPFEGQEAHNTFIDILSITGVVGLGAYLWLLATIFRRNLRDYLASYYSMLGIITFSAFHFTLRHPIFWFAIVVACMASMHRRADGATVERFLGGGKRAAWPGGSSVTVSGAGMPAA